MTNTRRRRQDYDKDATRFTTTTTKSACDDNQDDDDNRGDEPVAFLAKFLPFCENMPKTKGDGKVEKRGSESGKGKLRQCFKPHNPYAQIFKLSPQRMLNSTLYNDLSNGEGRKMSVRGYFLRIRVVEHNNKMWSNDTVISFISSHGHMLPDCKTDN